MTTGSKRIASWRHKTKLAAIEMLGGSCCICGYSKCKAALEFHHVDPGTKVRHVAKMTSHPRKKLEILKEVKKCVLLCANHHREFHAGLIALPPTAIAGVSATVDVSDPRYEYFLRLPRGGRKRRQRKSPPEVNWRTLPRQDKRKVERPSRETLAHLIWDKPVRTTARELGVTDNTVRKWCKREGITNFPPRRYWPRRHAGMSHDAAMVTNFYGGVV
jgi:hypothetical protein